MTVRLLAPVNVTSVSVEHVAREEAVDISSAPAQFIVYGLHSENGPSRYDDDE